MPPPRPTLLHRSVPTLIAAFALLCAAVFGQAATPAAPGRAATPPMGFNNWYSTFCRPEFNEDFVRGTADRLVALGLADAGYRYVNLDDCWAEGERDAQGRLVPSRTRFPHGLKALGEYLHTKGFQFGIYTSAGTATCARREDGGFPGGLGHEREDAALFAELGVDYVKYDNCNNQKVPARQRYAAMGEALRATGHTFMYSLCEWGENKAWLWGKDEPVGATSWRTTLDIEDKYPIMLRNAAQTVVLDAYAGPGHWNDPDFLEVGNGGMSALEYRSQFSLWAIMAAPLVISTDLRKADATTLAILGNREVIAVDQDALGKPGHRVRNERGLWVVVRPLADGSRAVAVFNSGDSARDFSLRDAETGARPGTRLEARNLWTHVTQALEGPLTGQLAPHETALYRIAAAH